MSENRYDPAESRLDIDYTFIRDGTVETRPAASYVFTVAEIRQDAGKRRVRGAGASRQAWRANRTSSARRA